MIDWRQHTLDMLKTLNLRPSKKKGQNFLIRPSITKKMISFANISSESQILEIGGGLGILTKNLLKDTTNVLVIEKDPKLARYLKTKYKLAQIVTDDALKSTWPDNCIIISNLPYSISGPILSKILHHNFTIAILMVQKEIAERCIAKPGDRNYSRLSILTQLHSKPKMLFDVSPEAFYPVPKVVSSVMKFEPKESTTVNTHTDIELLVRNLFTLRRRTLRSVLRGFLKRKRDDQVWDRINFPEKRIFHLLIEELDQICTQLKQENAWPLA